MRLDPRRGAALALLALCAGYLALALRLEDAVTAPVFVLGPRSFPLAVGVTGILVAILLLLERSTGERPRIKRRSVVRSSIERASIERSSLERSSTDRSASFALDDSDLVVDPTPARAFAGDWRRTLALCAFMLLYAAALPRAGFMLSTAAFLAASFRLLGERRVVTLGVVPIAVAVAVLVLLRGVFGAHLPEPWLEALLR